MLPCVGFGNPEKRRIFKTDELYRKWKIFHDIGHERLYKNKCNNILYGMQKWRNTNQD